MTLVPLQLNSIAKTFGHTEAVADVNLSVEPGKLLALLGPSGCGKTTLLRMIAGFVAPTAGSIELGGRNITDLSPNKRNIGIVFQNYALFPHMTVAENAAFGLKVRGHTSDAVKQRVDKVLGLVRLNELGDRYPSQLSGGQQQRAAVARALAIDPALLLLDEPLSALDKSLRQEVQQELRHLQKSVGITCIVVTHDQEEAFALADEIAVMHVGRIVQRGAPQDIYDRPCNRFVASFIGAGNFLPGIITSTNANEAGVVLGHDAAHAPIAVENQNSFAKGDMVELFFRPERVRLSPTDYAVNTRDIALPARVVDIRPMGPRLEVECEAAAGLHFFSHVSSHEMWVGLGPGSNINALVARDHLRCLKAAL